MAVLARIAQAVMLVAWLGLGVAAVWGIVVSMPPVSGLLDMPTYQAIFLVSSLTLIALGVMFVYSLFALYIAGRLRD